MRTVTPARSAPTWLALATGISLALAGCSPSGDAPEAPASGQPSDKTVASLLAGDDRFSAIADVLTDTGVASVFDGAGSYTVLAPTDAALGALSDAGNFEDEDERRVLLIALLRNHILPGDVTPASIRDAVAESGGPVTMRNLAGGIVTFSLKGKTILIEGQDGTTGQVDGEMLHGSNGAVIPVNAPLAPLPGGS